MKRKKTDYFPLLRSLQFQPLEHEGEQLWIVNDPFHLHADQLILPYSAARLALLCNGKRSVTELSAFLAKELRETPPPAWLDEVIFRLDEHFLLDNARSQQQIAGVREAYLSEPCRPPLLAGPNYPDNPSQLSQFLGQWREQSAETPPNLPPLRGLVSPHIDYQRGGEVYSRVWEAARGRFADCDLILLFATDHQASQPSLTLSHLPYETPYGIVPTDAAIVERLATAIGPDQAFQAELNHLQEHSIELVAVWLHYIQPTLPPVVPILVGSFRPFTLSPDSHPLNDQRIGRFLDTVREIMRERRVFCVASADLAHVGPAFDTQHRLDEVGKTTLTQQDDQLIAAIEEGSAEKWYQLLARDQNANQVCGFSPVYLLLEALGSTAQGQRMGYAHCSADAAQQSLVSICGALLQ